MQSKVFFVIPYILENSCKSLSYLDEFAFRLCSNQSIRIFFSGRFFRPSKSRNWLERSIAHKSLWQYLLYLSSSYRYNFGLMSDHTWYFIVKLKDLSSLSYTANVESRPFIVSLSAPSSNALVTKPKEFEILYMPLSRPKNIICPSNDSLPIPAYQSYRIIFEF